ncbi:histidine--tRNA ligase [Flavobacterium sp. SUN052]|uniref:histidine--tRNA ligase n=1 Tax=Flavobacterium sp. SUN052 TaxID=3002441 RepID=UPI00237EA1BC|nr:histidine--tRNA ligase [Flavobacterium sp. SUN052]MEC4005461.1 histidine--tRNA ligase [Flavobacterium sp. SUN052]
MASKPSIPKGTRDFSPIEVSKRNYIISIMRNHFENYGYQPIETPSFENSDTLMGKYGEEGDRLIFKILNSGDYLKEVRNDVFYSGNISAVFFDVFDNLINFSIDQSEKFDEYLEKFLSIYLKFKISTEEKLILNEVFENNKNRLLEFDNNKGIENPNLIPFRREVFTDFYKRYIDVFPALNSNKATKIISEKALRYDLTVPFARYVVQHQNEIEFPFKRYQIQPVWRADRPQKGRFREFYQCDADVVGSTSLWQEVELVQLYDAVFAELGLNGVTIKINNRKILSGIAEVIGASDKLIDFTVALDKLDKIGEDGVKKELLEKGISEEAILKVQPLFNFTGTIQEKIGKLSELLSSSDEGRKGIEELRFICENVQKLGLKKATLDLDVTLARGLNYYTGAIFEVAAPAGVAMGSIGGGGRYDDLTGIFGLKNMSGVGISFGLDRIYLVLEELGLFPETVTNATKVMFLNFGDNQAFEALQVIQKLRSQNIKAELYPDATKIDKQFKYAERRAIPFVVKEILGDKFILKNIVSGEQSQVNFEELLDLLN